MGRARCWCSHWEPGACRAAVRSPSIRAPRDDEPGAPQLGIARVASLCPGDPRGAPRSTSRQRRQQSEPAWASRMGESLGFCARGPLYWRRVLQEPAGQGWPCEWGCCGRHGPGRAGAASLPTPTSPSLSLSGGATAVRRETKRQKCSSSRRFAWITGSSCACSRCTESIKGTLTSGEDLCHQGRGL